MNSAILMTAILISGFLIGVVAIFLIENIIAALGKLKKISDDNRLFVKKQEEVKNMKANGELHEWVSIPTPSGDTLVCKKTGWCPSLEGFVPTELITSYLEKAKKEEEYRNFRNKRVEKLAKELGFSIGRMEEIVEQIFAMKKDFALLKIEELQRSLEERATDVREQQDKI